MDDLEVTTEDNQLVIKGRNTDENKDRVYLHRGIAARQFQRSFVLAEGIEVVTARLEDGLLHIDMIRPLPEPEVRKIKIEKAQSVDKKNLKKIETIDLDTVE